jgi:hypothetical protein
VAKPVVHRETVRNVKAQRQMSFSRELEVPASFLHCHAVAFFIPECGMSQKNKIKTKRNLGKCMSCVSMIII